MPRPGADRREFLKSSIAAAGLAALAPAGKAHAAGPDARPAESSASAPSGPARIRFAVVGVNHPHVHRQIEAVVRGGGELVSFFAPEPELAAAFAKRYPKVKLAASAREIIESDKIQLVASAGIPNERAALGIEVMRHGKDFLSDKPGMTTLQQLANVRRVQAETKRIYSILYSERHESRATVKAGNLVQAGAIGKVIQTLGIGPHRLNAKTRPAWFFEKERYGGVLCDIASHQFEQFLFFTGSTRAEIVAAQVSNVHHPEYPGLEDFGDVMLRSERGTGYIRVDWFTPDGLATWGDGRLTILGTEGTIEVRKYVDLAGRPGADHLLLVDGKGTRYFDCKDEPLPFGGRLVDDVLNRTETAMPQQHCFYAMELALKAQKAARKIVS
jgi:predicted dehydrogenase